MSNIDPQILRAVDLGRTNEIASKIQLLEFFRQGLMRSMFFNEARMGSIGQYSNAVNTQVNQSASYNQTEGFFETHRLIVEKMLNGLMNRAKHVYRDREEKLSVIMDDVSAVDLELMQNFWYEEVGVKFSTSTDEINRIEQLRAQSMAFIQNGMSFDSILELVMAKTPSDIMSIFKKESKRIEQQRQEALQAQAQQAEADRQSKLQEIQIKEQAQTERKLIDAEVKKLQATLGIEQWRAQVDADQDGRADSIQRAEMEIRHKKAVEDRKAQQKDRELDIKEMEAESRANKN